MVGARSAERRPTRRAARRKQTSYAEPDSDDFDDDQDSEADFQPEPQRPSKRRKLNRKTRRFSYHGDDEEQSEEEDSQADFEPQPRRALKRSQPNRRTRQTRDISDDEDESDDAEDGEADFDRAPQRPARQSRAVKKAKPRAQPVERTRTKSAQPSRPRKRRNGGKKSKPLVLGAPRKPKIKKESKFTGASDGKIPSWTSLPIDILREMFIFASQPIREQTRTAVANAGWLMRAARTCRALALPALEAYYQSPYPHDKGQPHYLLELLQMPKDKTYIDYAVKVKSLEMDVTRLAYSAHGKSLVNVSSIVRLLPQLRHLEITHPVYEPPYRKPNIQKWHYPSDLFHALDEGGARLKTWRWDKQLIPETDDVDLYTFIQLAHTSKSFEHLEKLVVCGFDVNDLMPSQTSGDEETVQIPRLASLISQLPHLKDLTFVSCDAVVDNFLDHIPQNLERLELSNCLEVTSIMLGAYLKSGGAHLRELVLDHNSAVDLSFLQHLKKLCPRLELLKMDFTYYSERYNYNDAWAMYDQLLTEDHIPTWPSTLRHLELTNMQKCTAEAAQNLFRSLVDGAKDLPDLRRLVIQAHINIPWRDRAQFRDQWIERLNTVYLRRSEPPNSYFGSLRQYRLYKAAEAQGRTTTTTMELDSDEEPLARRRLSQVRVTPRKPPTDVPYHSDIPATAEKPAPARRSTRVAERVESFNASTAAEDDSSDEEHSSDEAGEQEELYIQGLCNVVDIRIDNQRPRENQFTEANFLDSEPSGDEDWQEGADMSGEDEYAW